MSRSSVEILESIQQLAGPFGRGSHLRIGVLSCTRALKGLELIELLKKHRAGYPQSLMDRTVVLRCVSSSGSRRLGLPSRQRPSPIARGMGSVFMGFAVPAAITLSRVWNVLPNRISNLFVAAHGPTVPLLLLSWVILIAGCSSE